MEKRAKDRGKKRKGKQIEYSSDSESDFVEELIKSKSKKPRTSEIDTSHLQEEEEEVKPKKKVQRLVKVNFFKKIYVLLFLFSVIWV